APRPLERKRVRGQVVDAEGVAVGEQRQDLVAPAARARLPHPDRDLPVEERSPGAMLRTSAPTSSTIPLGSWPRMSPSSSASPSFEYRVLVPRAISALAHPVFGGSR